MCKVQMWKYQIWKRADVEICKIQFGGKFVKFLALDWASVGWRLWKCKHPSPRRRRCTGNGLLIVPAKHQLSTPQNPACQNFFQLREITNVLQPKLCWIEIQAKIFKTIVIIKSKHALVILNPNLECIQSMLMMLMLIKTKLFCCEAVSQFSKFSFQAARCSLVKPLSLSRLLAG